MTDENFEYKEIIFDITVLNYIRQLMNESFKKFVKNLEPDGIINQEVINIIYQIIECNFVLQIINITGVGKFYNVVKLKEYPNTFVADSLFDSEDSIISTTNFLSNENKVKITFSNHSDKDTILIPKDLYGSKFNIFYLMLIAFDLLLEMSQSDKRQARNSIISTVLDYENRLIKQEEELRKAGVLIPSIKRRNIFINEIKIAIQKIGYKRLSLSEIARWLKLPPQTFKDRLKDQSLKINTKTGDITDLKSGEIL